jgi:preprotein translocase subunit SecD
MVPGKRRKNRKKDRKTQKAEAGSMSEEEPFYKKPRVLLLLIVILCSIAVMTVSYKNGELKIGNNLRYGLDLEGGSWLQLQLQGAIAQVNADEKKIIQSEFTRLLNDPSVKIEETTFNSITFTTSKQTTQKIIDNFGFGKSTISQAPDGGTRISLATSREFVIQKYLENNLNAEVIRIPGNLLTFEIRTNVTEDELNTILQPVDGKVIPPFRVGVTAETRDETKKILETKLNSLGLKEIPIRTVGDNYILIDLAGVDITTAKDIAAKPGKFEIRIQVKGNETEHVLYGTEITPGLPEKEKGDVWGVSFVLSDAGAAALRDAAIKYGAVTNPTAHNLIMYLDENEIFNAPLSTDLARNIQSVPVKNLVATTGTGEEGQKKANELQIHLRAGALPVNVDVVGAGQVSAELGSRFKSQILIAGIIALILVVIVVSLRYKQPNIVIPMLSTSFSEVIIILGFTVVVGFQLDLPTIAGIIAVIGTGIDHLIIITDEVLAGGAMPPDKVYKSRLTKAFTIIFSAAATVLVAMSPLLIMGFGALKGFAVITIVGVLIGVFIARPAYAEVIQGMLVEDTSKKFVDED